MKAAVIHKYGGPSELKLEDFKDPVAGEGEVLVRVAAASINPVDWKRRSGSAHAKFPVNFPGILGRDFSGTVRAVGPGVGGFAPGDKVFGLAWETYAELCVAKAAELARVPEGLDLVEAAALPLVTLTGEQLIRVAAQIQAGQTVLITGALGGVGRSAVWAAKEAGAKVIVGVRKKQLEAARELKADEVLAVDDDDAMHRLGFIDAVADTVGGKVATVLLGKVKQGGVFASVVGAPKDAALHPTIRIAAIMTEPDPARLVQMGEAVVAKRLTIPIDRMLALEDAGEGQAAAEKGGIGKVLLLA